MTICSMLVSGVALAVIGFGAAGVTVPTMAYGDPAPGCDGRCSSTSNPDSTDSTVSTDEKGGSDWAPPEVPAYKAPEPKVSNRPVIVRRDIDISDDVTPPVVSPQPDPVDVTIVIPRIPGIPIDFPPIPIDIPVDTPVDIPQVAVEPPAVEPELVPVAVPVTPPPVAPPQVAPPPIAPPVIPEPPTAPALPAPASPQVLLTSSAEPGTQALTLILMFLTAGGWIYGHRIASHWTVGR